MLLGLFIQNTVNKTVCLGHYVIYAACDGARVINDLRVSYVRNRMQSRSCYVEMRCEFFIRPKINTKIAIGVSYSLARFGSRFTKNRLLTYLAWARNRGSTLENETSEREKLKKCTRAVRLNVMSAYLYIWTRLRISAIKFVELSFTYISIHSYKQQ